ncbi:MAG: Hsp20/alpha crystallin family protein [bacterium]|nr:Hsp20/alpha crystallin family protein [bacterium]MDT8365852.1 Hsp20/alpha crystallin family protein [bacterium]
MAATTRSPFRELMALQDRMNRIFDSSAHSEGTDEEMEAAGWTPAVDIYETTDAILVNVEAPGMSRDQFTVEVKDDVLTLKGERPFEKDVSREHCHRIERAYGRFRRSFVLGVSIRTDMITAAYMGGVLEVVLPKVEESKARKIEITE